MTKLEATIQNDQLVSGCYGDITFGPWGIECSDQHSFVTLTDTPRNAQRDGNIWHLSSGRLEITLATSQTSANGIKQHATFTALDDVALQDAVIRMVFDKSAIAYGIIAGRTVTHSNSDKYRLHATRDAKLFSSGGKTVTVTLDHADGLGRFDPYLYLRDRADDWIIHARLLPTEPVDHVWLRWANRLFTATAPVALADLLWRFGLSRKLLWRMRERMGRHCPEIQAVPLNILKRGQSLELEVTCHFH